MIMNSVHSAFRDHVLVHSGIQMSLNKEWFPVIMYTCESWTIKKVERPSS